MSVNQLARTLGLADYFALAFGVMIGVGWLVVMDDWLQRGGPVGALLGFAIGAVVLLPVGWVYGKLVAAIPDAAAEAAYTALVFPEFISFAAGWMIMLAYFIVCPYEAVSIGTIAGYLFPKLNSFPLYTAGGNTVYAPHILLGLVLTVIFVALNCRGIKLSARFLRYTTAAVLVSVALFATAGWTRGTVANFRPGFSHSPLVSILLVLQIVPYFLTGFDSVGKCAEEASPDFQSGGFSTAVMLSIFVGLAFYVLVIASVAVSVPWQSITHETFATAVAFERALGSPWITKLIMATALTALLKIFNANLLTASRLLFALARRKLVDSRLAVLHPVNQTPAVAIISVGIAVGVTLFVGRSILVPISDVGALAGALAWMAACAAYYKLSPTAAGRRVAALGVAVTVLIVLMKVLPFVEGHFSTYEWLAFLAWCVVGALVKKRTGGAPVSPPAATL